MSEKRKVIVLCPVRNEEDNLRRLIPAWRLYADLIIVADQRSEDNTRKVLSQFDNVIVVDNADSEYSEGKRNSLLVNKAREITPEGIFLFLDADETLSANILNSLEWRKFQDQKPGTVGMFRWVDLWKGPFKYFYEATDKFAFIDDGRPFDSQQIIHGPRGSLKGRFTNEFFFKEVVNLHISSLNFEMLIRKNNWYKAWWMTIGAKKYQNTNCKHNWFYTVREKDLQFVPEEWLKGFIDKGIDVGVCPAPDLLWYDIEILRFFDKYGVGKFYLSDIWGEVDWEEKRRFAISRGIGGIPQTPIKKPNRAIVFYNGLSKYDYPCPRWIKKIIHALMSRILP